MHQSIFVSEYVVHIAELKPRRTIDCRVTFDIYSITFKQGDLHCYVTMSASRCPDILTFRDSEKRSDRCNCGHPPKYYLGKYLGSPKQNTDPSLDGFLL